MSGEAGCGADPAAAEWLRAAAVVLAGALDEAGFYRAAAYAEMAADAVAAEVGDG